MKILMCTMALDIGGAETHIFELSKELASRGNDVTIASNGGIYAQNLEKYGIKHVMLPLNAKDPASIWKCYFGLKKLIKNEKYDIVHAHARIPALFCSMLQKRFHYRLVTTAHFNFTTAWYMRMLTRWGDKTIAVSHDLRDYLLENYNVRCENIYLTINGLDTKRFSHKSAKEKEEIEKEFSLCPGAPRIVHVSRLDRETVLVASQLIELVPELEKKYPGIEIMIAGGGDRFEYLSGLAAAANEKLGRRAVVLCGPRGDIDRILACGNIFVGVSRAALEAMSEELPVILAGNQGALYTLTPTIYEKAVEGNFCCRGNQIPTAKQLYREVCGLLGSGREEELGKFARQAVLTGFSAARMCDDYLNVYKTLTPYAPYRYGEVLICGYYGNDNTGDEAILRAIITQLRERKPDLRITALSASPNETRKDFSINTVYRYDLFGVKNAIKHAKLIIFGGGSLLQNTTSTRSLMYYTWLLKYASKSGKKTMLWANGLGPIFGDRGIQLAKRALSYCDAVTLRDYRSAGIYEQMTGKEAVVTADAAFTAEAPDSLLCRSVLEKYRLEKEKYYILALRSWDNDRKFEDIIKHFCIYINKKYGLKPVFTAFQSQIDLPLSNTIAKNVGGICASKLSYSEITALCGSAAFVLGMRYHSLVVSAGKTPVIPVSYDPKVASLAERLGIGQEEIFDISKLTAQELCKAADNVLKNRDTIIEKQKKLTEGLKESAKKDIETALELLEQ